MARAPHKVQASATALALMAGTAQSSAEETKNEAAAEVPEGYTHSHNSSAAAADPTKAETAAKLKADKFAAKAEKDAKKAADAAAKKHERELAKADRAAKLAELAEGKGYTGSMLALAEKVKSGEYVKSATGQLRSNDALAVLLDTVPPSGVIKLAKALELPGEYSHLNVGQQSMNYRNRMRGALKKATLTIEQIKITIADLDLDAAPEIAARVQAVADAKASRELKAANKTVKPVAETAEA